jgi:uncharacterized protein (DUF1501 family)
MPTTRRQFIKRSAAAVSVSLVMPKLWMRDALAQTADPNRKIFVVIQLGGGNDGLNTVVPFTNSRYQSLRPTIGFRDADLKDAAGNPTMITNDLALHPSLAELKSLYDAQRVAIIQGVGYPTPSLSHFLSMDIWHTASTSGAGYGWLGKYADQKLLGASGFTAASVDRSLAKTMFGNDVVIPNISVGGANVQNLAERFRAYNFLTDGRFTGDRNNQLNTFRATNSRSLPAGSFAAEIADTGLDAVDGAQQVQNSVDDYTSSVTYPIGTAPNVNNLAIALQMVAQLITTLPSANLFYVSLGGFDHHSQEIGSNAEPTNRLVGQHATLLRYFSQAVKAFYDDMAAHGLADNVLMMQWSEFGRRPNENASRGTDHSTASVMFVIGNPVRGGLYGDYPSLDATQLDNGGNMRFTTDFRRVYAEILDRWLAADSQSILGAGYSSLGFLS